MAHIITQDLVKSYRRRTSPGGWRGALGGFLTSQTTTVRAVDGLSFRIGAGELVAFLGANGAGKSTVIKMLVGILQPDSGRCEVNGLDPSRERRRHVDHIGVVFGQRSQLWWDLPVRDTFSLLRTVYDRDAATWARSCDELVGILGLGPLLERPVRQLSLGERLRCELAAALLHQPAILFLDEPTIGLDAGAKLAVRGCLQRINRERGVTILLTTHDLDDVEVLAHRVLVLNAGRLLLDGNLAQLRQHGGHTRMVRIESAEAIHLASRAGVEVVAHAAGHLQLRVVTRQASIAEVVREALAAGPVIDLAVLPPPIEELVAALYAEAAS